MVLFYRDNNNGETSHTNNTKKTSVTKTTLSHDDGGMFISPITECYDFNDCIFAATGFQLSPFT